MLLLKLVEGSPASHAGGAAKGKRTIDSPLELLDTGDSPGNTLTLVRSIVNVWP